MTSPVHCALCTYAFGLVFSSSGVRSRGRFAPQRVFGHIWRQPWLSLPEGGGNREIGNLPYNVQDSLNNDNNDKILIQNVSRAEAEKPHSWPMTKLLGQPPSSLSWAVPTASQCSASAPACRQKHLPETLIWSFLVVHCGGFLSLLFQLSTRGVALQSSIYYLLFTRLHQRKCARPQPTVPGNAHYLPPGGSPPHFCRWITLARVPAPPPHLFSNESSCQWNLETLSVTY